MNETPDPSNNPTPLVTPEPTPTFIPPPGSIVNPPLDSLSATAVTPAVSSTQPQAQTQADPPPFTPVTTAIPTATTSPLPPEESPVAMADSPTENTGNTAISIIWALVSGIFNWLIVPFAIVLVLHFFVFQAFHVVGHSMIPTLQQSDYLIISKVDASLARLSRVWGKSGNYVPNRGEIIVFRYPGNPQQIFVKRVVGLPGDRVNVKGGKVTVFNSTHPDGLSPDATHQVSDPISLGDVDETVQAGKVFVMGDNRSPGGSFDSRDWGELPSDNIIGKALLRLLPFDKFKVLGTS